MGKSSVRVRFYTPKLSPQPQLWRTLGLSNRSRRSNRVLITGCVCRIDAIAQTRAAPVYRKAHGHGAGMLGELRLEVGGRRRSDRYGRRKSRGKYVGARDSDQQFSRPLHLASEARSWREPASAVVSDLAPAFQQGLEESLAFSQSDVGVLHRYDRSFGATLGALLTVAVSRSPWLNWSSQWRPCRPFRHSSARGSRRSSPAPQSPGCRPCRRRRARSPGP